MLWRRNIAGVAVCLAAAWTSLALADGERQTGERASVTEALTGQDGAAVGFVRIRDDLVVPADAVDFDTARPLNPSGRGGDVCCSAPAGFGLEAYAWRNQASPEGGLMSPATFMNSTCINDYGVIVFMSDVNDIERNQGIFVSDEGVLTAIVKGCGNGGGSGVHGNGVGDASPIGGTFSGFFAGTAFTPAINNSGDVLFIADVDGGSAPRGLFLHRAATDAFEKVAAVGDACPTGGTLTEIGVGSMNNNAIVAFLAKDSVSGKVNVYKWDDGTVTKVVAAGDAAPGGGAFTDIATESFGYADGTHIPSGVCPGINDAGQISFWGKLDSSALATRGLFVATDGVIEWYVSNNDTAPAGDTYVNFYGPQINNNGEIAFFAYFYIGGSQSAGWFAGSPTDGYRCVLKFHDVVEGEEAISLSISRNPMRAIDDCGNVLLYTMYDFGNEVTQDVLVLVTPDGEKMVIGKEGDTTPAGGTIGWLNGWPSINNARQGTLSGDTFGTPGGANNTHFVYTGWLTGDLDGDNDVDLSDLAALLAYYGETSGATFAEGDMDGDGDVDLSDLAALLGTYGAECMQ